MKMTTMQKHVRLVSMIALLFAVIFLAFQAKAERGLNVVVIAHSLSTRAEARAVLRKQGWFETENLRQADGILVVCRSNLKTPLSDNYISKKELDEDADSQLNISGANFHIYVFRINDNLSVDEVNHVRHEAGDR